MALTQYSWIPICACVFAFFCAFGIGANDVANAFGTSVGAGALSLKQAILIAAVMEFSGAFLLGGNVASTIMKGITDVSYFEKNPEVLMFGMLCVLIGVAAWLILATLYSLPVSTTHSCIGGIIGMAIVAYGWNAVYWKQVLMVVLSWFVSPVASAILSTIIFVIVRKWILHAEDPYKRGLSFYPYIISFTIALNLFIVLYKSKSLNITAPVWVTALICLLVGTIIAVIIQFLVIPCIKRKVAREEEKKKEELRVKDVNVEIEMVKKETEIPVEVEMSKEGKAEVSVEVAMPKEEEKKEDGFTKKQNIHAELEDEQSKVYQMHKNAEVFDERTEKLFSYLQIVTAIFNSFAHGANDVANAIGPVAACINIYNSGSVSGDAEVPTWVLVLGGIGIVAGLACLGYKIMAAIGVNMIKVTPSRGFSIEIGSSLVIIIGSAAGLPLSTTHCKVGSTVGVGMAEGKNGVNWKLLYGIFAGWIFTIVICAVSVALIFGFALYSPIKPVSVLCVC